MRTPLNFTSGSWVCLGGCAKSDKKGKIECHGVRSVSRWEVTRSTNQQTRALLSVAAQNDTERRAGEVGAGVVRVAATS